MLHGAGIFTNICPCPKSPSFVRKYSSTMVRIWVFDYIVILVVQTMFTVMAQLTIINGMT